MGGAASSKSSTRYRKDEEEEDIVSEVEQSFSGHRAVVNSLSIGDPNSLRALRGKNISINMNSVRQLAKSTHNRQENSYIPHEEMSSFFRTVNFHQAHSIRVIPADFTNPNVGPITTINEDKDKRQDKREKTSAVIYEKTEQLYSAARGLETVQPFMENKFQLKINIGGVGESVDPPDLQPAVEEEIVPDNKKFSEMLIALPLPKGKEEGEVPPSSFMNMKTDDGGLMVDGFEIGVNGIVRSQSKLSNPLTPTSEQAVSIRGFRNKLPMSERLIILCKLGQGASSIVYKALDLKDMKLVAVKMIQVFDRDKRHQMVSELGGLFHLLRKNSVRMSANRGSTFYKPDKYIVDFYDAFSNLEDGIVAFIIEYMDGGSLQDIADSGGCNYEPTLANIAIQSLKGLEFLHGCSQIHRDLKPGNLLISHRGEVKVADLGIMKQLDANKNGKKGVLPTTSSFVGTTTYMSPERIDGKPYSFPSDVWAFGLSMHTVVMGSLAVDTSGGYWSILQSIRDEPPPRLPADSFSPELCDFVGRCLQKNPEDRWTCRQLLEHPFLSKAVADDSADDIFDKDECIKELQSIISAIYCHIKEIKLQFQSTPSTTHSAGENSKTPRHSHRIFGDLNMSAEELLYVVMFGKKKSGSDRIMIDIPALGTPGIHGQKKTAKMQLLRPKLLNFAKQLHMPLDALLDEAHKHCDNLTGSALTAALAAPGAAPVEAPPASTQQCD